MILVYGKGKVGQGIGELLDYLKIPFEIKDDADRISNFEKYKLIIPSPGIKSTHPIYKHKNKIIGELDLIHKILTEKLNFKLGDFFYTNGKQKIFFIGITGTDGKSSTTWQIYNLIKKVISNINATNYKVWIGGNFDIPVSKLILDFLKNLSENNIFVLEVSSFMAYKLQNLFFLGSLWTNFDTDHLDWHQDLQNYFNAKKNLTQNSKIVFPTFVKKQKKYKFFKTKRPSIFIKKILQQLNLPTPSNISKTMQQIPSLPHRFQNIGKIGKTIVIDDSKCTTKNCLKYGLEKINGKTILTAGGFDKGIDYQDLEKLLKEKVIFGILFGDIKDKLKKVFEKAGVNYKIFDNFDQAINEAIKLSQKLQPDYLIFSPAASSFDMFSNRKQRAQRFLELVRKYMRTSRNLITNNSEKGSLKKSEKKVIS